MHEECSAIVACKLFKEFHQDGLEHSMSCEELGVWVEKRKSLQQKNLGPKIKIAMSQMFSPLTNGPKMDGQKQVCLKTLPRG